MGDDKHISWSTITTIFHILTIPLFYILCGVFYYVEEDWGVLQSVYFITVTLFTVGYGDLTPKHAGSKVFTMIVIVFSLVYILGVVNSIASAAVSYVQRTSPSPAETVKPQTTYGYVIRMAIPISMILLLLLFGALYMMYMEDITFINALWWALQTSTTVGYGDFIPSSNHVRVFVIFYIYISVTFVGYAIAQFGVINYERSYELKRQELLKKELDLDYIKSLNTNKSDNLKGSNWTLQVSKIDFLAGILIQMNGLDMDKDIRPWLKRFDELDKDGSGYLDENDLLLFHQQEIARRAEQISSNNDNEHTLRKRPSLSAGAINVISNNADV